MKETLTTKFIERSWITPVFQLNEINDFQPRPQAMKFHSDFRFVYFSNLLINSKLLRELDGLVVNRAIVHLCYGYFGAILRSKGLKLIRLSRKDNGFYQNSYTLEGPHWIRVSIFRLCGAGATGPVSVPVMKNSGGLA